MPSKLTVVLLLCSFYFISAEGAKSSPRNQTDTEIVDRFHSLWYSNRNTWKKNTWLGIPTHQNPMDVWVTQEILTEVKPDFFIECGSASGGSAALWATILEQVNPQAKVISIDIRDTMQEARKLPIVQKRVEFIVSSSTDPSLVEKLALRVQGKKVVVLLDSDHHKKHVAEEMRLYAPLVSVGSYLIVQDSNINGHPVRPNWGEGPWEAIAEFLKKNSAFESDKTRERLLFTLLPNGYLKKTKP